MVGTRRGLFGFLGGFGFEGGFVGDVEFFHVEAEGEASLGVDGGGGVVEDGGDGHENPLDDHEDGAVLFVVFGARGEHFYREEDSDEETDEGDHLDTRDGDGELVGDEVAGGFGVDEEGDPTTEGDEK